jgi:hypothetical protein
MLWARSAHRVTAALVAAVVVTQFFLAGAGAFGATSFRAHTLLGTLLLVLAGIAVALALLGRTLVRHTLLVLVLVAVQLALGVLGADAQAWFGALHAVNALAVMGGAATLARSAAAAAGLRRSEPALD